MVKMQWQRKKEGKEKAKVSKSKISQKMILTSLSCLLGNIRGRKDGASTGDLS